jgi:ATP-dependent DNA ligase
LARLRSRSCIIDGEAVACDDNGLSSFDLIRHHRANGSVFLYAFDLIALDGDDLRRDPLQVRKATLASILSKARPGIRFNEHIEGDGPTVFVHAWTRRQLCQQGLRLSFGPRARLAQDEESGLLGSEAGSGGGVGAVIGR